MMRVTNPSALRQGPTDLGHNPRMLRHSVPAKALWLFAILVLVARVGDAHLHFCGDGQEQAVALHTGDPPGQHHQDEADQGHKDRDLDISGPTLFKKISGFEDVGLAVVATDALFSSLPAPVRIEPSVTYNPIPLASAFLLRPPLRGPPL